MKASLMLLLLFLIGTASCSRQIAMKGETYISTKGGTTIKLPSVRIQVYGKDSLKSYFAKKQIEMAQLQVDEKAASDAYDLALKNDDRDNSSPSNKFNVRYNSADAARKTYEDLMAKSRDRGLIDFFAYGLPAGDFETTTDVDGKFTLTMPRPGKYLIFARTQRTVMDNIEYYGWFTTVDTKEPDALISLNDHNMVYSRFTLDQLAMENSRN